MWRCVFGPVPLGMQPHPPGPVEPELASFFPASTWWLRRLMSMVCEFVPHCGAAGFGLFFVQPVALRNALYCVSVSPLSDGTLTAHPFPRAALDVAGHADDA